MENIEKKKYKIMGVLIMVSSLMSLGSSSSWFLFMPLIFALGCILYCLGDIFEHLKQ